MPYLNTGSGVERVPTFKLPGLQNSEKPTFLCLFFQEAVLAFDEEVGAVRKGVSQ